MVNCNLCSKIMSSLYHVYNLFNIIETTKPKEKIDTDIFNHEEEPIWF